MFKYCHECGDDLQQWLDSQADAPAEKKEDAGATYPFPVDGVCVGGWCLDLPISPANLPDGYRGLKARRIGISFSVDQGLPPSL